jgi:hypothetical protein
VVGASARISIEGRLTDQIFEGLPTRDVEKQCLREVRLARKRLHRQRIEVAGVDEAG